MGLIKFELKEEHVKLLKHLRWSIKSEQIISKMDDDDADSPFGGDNLFEDMSLILNGKPDNFNPVDDEILVSELSDDDKIKLKELFNELPIALDIILNYGTFEPGFYKTKWYDRNWIKYEPKK
jgi:hypothetical protein